MADQGWPERPERPREIHLVDTEQYRRTCLDLIYTIMDLETAQNLYRACQQYLPIGDPVINTMREKVLELQAKVDDRAFSLIRNQFP